MLQADEIAWLSSTARTKIAAIGASRKTASPSPAAMSATLTSSPERSIRAAAGAGSTALIFRSFLEYADAVGAQR